MTRYAGHCLVLAAAIAAAAGAAAGLVVLLLGAGMIAYALRARDTIQR